MASVKPKWVSAKSADAAGSATFRDSAVPVISHAHLHDREKPYASYNVWAGVRLFPTRGGDRGPRPDRPAVARSPRRATRRDSRAASESEHRSGRGDRCRDRRREGLEAVTVRRLAADLGISAMALYTHVGSRDDLLVLMVDAVYGTRPRAAYTSDEWRERVRQVAETEMTLCTQHWWLLDVTDDGTRGVRPRNDRPSTTTNCTRSTERGSPTWNGTPARRSSPTSCARLARARRPDPPRAADMAELWATPANDWPGICGDDFPARATRRARPPASKR